jgi:hypothetical protein
MRGTIESRLRHVVTAHSIKHVVKTYVRKHVMFVPHGMSTWFILTPT